jgi:DNA cross-link repair 1A protein
MSVAEMLQKKVWVDKTRWKTIMCYDWDINDKAMVTTDKSATNIHVLSMNQINFNNFYNIKNKNGFAYSHIVGFSPTGWTHKSSGLIVPRTKDGNVIYDVPYSEHSSFNELKDFIKRMRPRYVIPTVKPADTKAQLDLLYERSAASAGKSEFF